ncbi:hypothetical protein L916_06669 [Phytophthora nicotianae]|uniref:Uncharacterized protein n=1 Tax=Phytophthora nicotianae TaxID=4792 RepID=W2J800_PHYNI|nr:hypothetical protein L916_06669 [Phytophthora nicotianae]
MIPKRQLSRRQKLLKIMWVVDLKTDHLSYVIDFKHALWAEATSNVQA